MSSQLKSKVAELTAMVEQRKQENGMDEEMYQSMTRAIGVTNQVIAYLEEADNIRQNKRNLCIIM